MPVYRQVDPSRISLRETLRITLFDKIMRLAATLVISIFVGDSTFAATTIAQGPAKVTIPDRFTIENKTVGDEGTISGFLTDSKTKIRIRFRVNDYGEIGLQHTKIEWQTLMHFERSPAGWYDRQIFVFEEDNALRIEARHAIHRTIFIASIPKGQDYHNILDALKLINVQLNQGWQLVRGKSPFEFRIFPSESK